MARLSLASGSKLRLVQGEAPAGAVRPELPAPLDDNELLNSVRSGDEAAATAFYHRVRAQVHATIARLLGHYDPELEDVAQLSLIELVSSIDRFRGECSLDSWTSKVTAHVICKQIRRRRLERGLFARDGADHPDAARSGRALVARDLLLRIRGHIDDMDEGRASAFLLHDVCGFDLREIAQMLDVSVAAAQKRLVRGRREVRERIGADPELAEALSRTEGET